jgi:hypothetical protein
VIWAWVAFYNYDTYTKLGQRAIERAVTSGVDEVGDGGAQGICGLGATWTTTCIATEQDNIVAPFACPNGLELGAFPPQADAAPADATSKDARHGDAAAVESSVESGPDAPSESGSDAHADAPPG